jgi:hypothetical protein
MDVRRRLRSRNFPVRGTQREGRLVLLGDIKIGDEVRLIRDDADSGAVLVALADGTVIGYVPIPDARVIAPALSDGFSCVARVIKFAPGNSAAFQ